MSRPLARRAARAGRLLLGLTAPRLALGAQAAATLPALPAPVTNNAVALRATPRGTVLYSFLGLDPTKRWAGIGTQAFELELSGTAWRRLPPVPGPRGRLAATAQAARGRIYLFGGYTVDSAGGERSLDAVDVYDPASGRWSAGSPIPFAVDDAVSGVWNDSLIYLISGWDDTDNTSRVQIYDPAADRWSEGTPIPGPAVFGHAGGIAGNVIVFVDGVRRQEGRPRYAMVSQAWRGVIDPQRPERIAWAPAPAHPGPPRYRAAAGTCGGTVVFAGGTDNPYNYDGVGYDGAPARPLDTIIGYDVGRDRWRELGRMPVATMDHRGLPIAERRDGAEAGRGWIIGGMREGQVVSATIVPIRIAFCDP